MRTTKGLECISVLSMQEFLLSYISLGLGKTVYGAPNHETKNY